MNYNNHGFTPEAPARLPLLPVGRRLRWNEVSENFRAVASAARPFPEARRGSAPELLTKRGSQARIGMAGMERGLSVCSCSQDGAKLMRRELPRGHRRLI